MSLIKICTFDDKKSQFLISPSKLKRDWMDETREKYAYRCLPLNIANQYGWTVHSPFSFYAEWNGSQEIDGLYTHGSNFVSSHFGHGILTINVDFVLKTEKNISIYVKGVSNNPKENIYPLEGIVETDWLPFTFTMNYKFYKPGRVEFYENEPLFMFFPIERSFIETFDIEYFPIELDENMSHEYNKYLQSRKEHIEEKRSGWQKYYITGNIVDEKKELFNHKTKMDLGEPKEFLN
jgi:hypothetical protein